MIDCQTLLTRMLLLTWRKNQAQKVPQVKYNFWVDSQLYPDQFFS